MRKRSNVLIQAVFVEMYDKEQWCLENVKLNQKLVPHNGRSLADTPDEGVLEFASMDPRCCRSYQRVLKLSETQCARLAYHIYRVVKKAMENIQGGNSGSN